MLKFQKKIFNSFLLLVSVMKKSSSKSNSMNDVLIDKLVSDEVIRSPIVEKVMRLIDRGDFTGGNYGYHDSPSGIGYSATISAPHMHAWALEILSEQLERGTRCLDVGSGSGYLTLAFSIMMNKPGAVAIGIEHIPELVEFSKQNINKNNADYLKSGKVVIIEGDGRFGLEEFKPYDCIHVGAAAESIPKSLTDQLANGGRLVIPVGKPGYQEFVYVDKDFNGKLKPPKACFGVTYVPLTSKEKQCPGKY